MLTWGRSWLERSAAAAAVAAEEGRFVGVDPLTVHLVGLRGFPQLGQDEATAPLRGGVHLEHLQSP